MKVILFKLDNPGNKYGWWVKDVTIKTSRDVEQIIGVCAEHSYAELYRIYEDDDPVVVEEVKKFIHFTYPTTAKDTILWLFTFIEKTMRLTRRYFNERTRL